MAETTNPSTELLTLPVLPLPNGVVLPGMVLTIALESDEAKAAIEATGDDERLLLVPRLDGRHAVVGTIATIDTASDSVNDRPPPKLAAASAHTSMVAITAVQRLRSPSSSVKRTMVRNGPGRQGYR